MAACVPGFAGCGKTILALPVLQDKPAGVACLRRTRRTGQADSQVGASDRVFFHPSATNGSIYSGNFTGGTRRWAEQKKSRHSAAGRKRNNQVRSTYPDLIMQFEFATATQIVFGEGALTQLPGLVRGLGTCAVVVTGRTGARAAAVFELLEKTGGIVSTITCQVPGEPTVDWVEHRVQAARGSGCDLVIGFGGGSAIDAAKAIAAMISNQGSLSDYLEVIGGGKPLTNPPVPVVAIPTTAGTGAEVTRNAVLLSPMHKVKVSLRSRLLLARLALVDPTLTYDLPPELTAATGMDALTQLIEAYVSCRANPMTDALCAEGIQRAARSLRAAFEDGRNATARRDMALASMFSGIALANAGLGAVHGFAGVIGGMFSAPHGAVCAALLPHVMAANIRALQARAAGAEALRRYDELGRLLTDRPNATATDGINWVTALVTTFGIRRLSTYGVSEADIPHIVQQAAKASSMKGNPITLAPAELAEIVQAAL